MVVGECCKGSTEQAGLKESKPVWLICELQRDGAGSKIDGRDRSKRQEA